MSEESQSQSSPRSSEEDDEQNEPKSCPFAIAEGQSSTILSVEPSTRS